MPKSISYFARPPENAPQLGAWCSIWRYLADGSVTRRDHYNLTPSSQYRLTYVATKMAIESGSLVSPGVSGWSLYP